MKGNKSHKVDSFKGEAFYSATLKSRLRPQAEMVIASFPELNGAIFF